MRTLIICLTIIVSIISCKEPIDDNMDCTGECLFTKANATGIVSYTDCYQKWSITFDADDLQAIIINPDEKIKVEGLKVEVDAIFFDNDFPFLLPDPPGPIQHKIEIRNYQILD